LTNDYLCVIINTTKKERGKMKMNFWDNDFDKMFDEAIEELENTETQPEDDRKNF
jgi:hypothetical protein